MNKILIKLYNFFYYIILFQIILWVTSFLPNLSYSNKIRGFLVKPFFKSCGKNFQLAKGAIINMSRNIEIGDNVYIAHNIWLNGAGGLNINNNVVISPNVVIATSKHGRVNSMVSNVEYELAPIIIEQGVWIASNTTVSLGIIIGQGSIIGAGSTVTKNITPNTFFAGVPAKKIKDL